MFKIFPLLTCLVFFSCLLFNEKHDEVWFFEWQICAQSDSLPITDAKLRCHLRGSPQASFISPDTQALRVDSLGYFFKPQYTEDQRDFLPKNPTLSVTIFDSSSHYLDTAVAWSSLVFKDQYLTIPHTDPTNAYIVYSTDMEYRNVCKQKIYINYPR